MFQYDNEYEVKKVGDGLMDHLVFNSKSPFPGLEIQYGEVKFIEEDDNHLRLKFKFEIFSNHKESHKMSEYLGKVLHEIIMQEFTYMQATRKEDE